ncbi:Agglutinin-like protein 3 [Komagataella phaffii CBS 7435]|uniref:Agglutinin-like protein 3 n=1 Tax=Komagataella phaffii (strain ATCC 76273 / CBS 7435 / CECT 11047 / NRRL Y-11430 / Wegner 21-1) TaxID=981350 RepID=F2QXP8_KOMPC|nr:Predicted protein [Komagataella phaffii CBS 7435]CCA40176.1 Agglutinin-like protein 3 [Komagataella phaffii CBS 7435]
MSLLLFLVLGAFLLSSVKAADIGAFRLRVYTPGRFTNGALNFNNWGYQYLDASSSNGQLFAGYATVTSVTTFLAPDDEGFVWGSSLGGYPGFLGIGAGATAFHLTGIPGDALSWYIEDNILKTSSPTYVCSRNDGDVVVGIEANTRWLAMHDTSQLPPNYYCFQADYEIVALWYIPDTTSTWTGTETSTTTDDDGSVIELVPTPLPDTTSTWTGTFTTFTTDDDGSVIELVPTPLPDSTSTWTGTYTTFTTDEDGSTIAVVPSSTIDSTSTWTGTYTTFTTDEDGSTIAVVPSSTIDSTSTWTGTYTTFTTDEDGSTIAVVPSSTIDSTSTWTGTYTTFTTDEDGSTIAVYYCCGTIIYYRLHIHLDWYLHHVHYR